MELYAIGLDFTKKAECFSSLQNPSKEELRFYQRRIRETFDRPALFLITCDRFEIYSYGKPYPHESAERILSLNPIVVKPFRYQYSSDEALAHLFHLSSGIISPLFGEDTIISQIVRSAEIARLEGASSPYLDKLFNMASAFGKKCQSTIRLRVYEKAIGDALKKIVADCRRILIVGSGEWAREIAKELSGTHEVVMTLRDEEKIFLLPPSVSSVSYDDRRKAAESADCVLSASSGLYHTFTDEDRSLLAGKLLIDLASPEDIPSSLSPIRLEDLGITLEERERNIQKVQDLAEQYIDDYRKWLSSSERSDDVSSDAISLANEVIRRLSGPVESLDIDSTDKECLRSAIYETVRKAYIGRILSRKE